MKIKEMPWFNRPGARLKRKGPSSLSDAELLAIVLGRGDKNENAIDQANRVLATQNLDKLSNLSLIELEQEFKNPVKALKIQAMFELFRRTNRLNRKGFKTQIKTAEDVYNHFVDTVKDKNKEHFYALLLDTKNRIIEEQLISMGILDASPYTQGKSSTQQSKPAADQSSWSIIIPAAIANQAMQIKK